MLGKRLYPTVKEQRELAQGKAKYFPAPCHHCACAPCEKQTACNCTIKIWDDCTCENHLEDRSDAGPVPARLVAE